MILPVPFNFRTCDDAQHWTKTFWQQILNNSDGKLQQSGRTAGLLIGIISSGTNLTNFMLTVSSRRAISEMETGVDAGADAGDTGEGGR